MASINVIEEDKIFEVTDLNFEWSWRITLDMSNEKYPHDRFVVAKDLTEIAFALWYNDYFKETPTEAIEDLLFGCGYKYTLEIIEDEE